MIAYKVSRTLDAYGVQGSLFQKRKQALNNARRGLQEVIRQLEIAFDESIDQVFVNEKQLTGQYGAFQKLASDTLQMLLIYHAHSEGPKRYSPFIGPVGSDEYAVQIRQDNGAIVLDTRIRYVSTLAGLKLHVSTAGKFQQSPAAYPQTVEAAKALHEWLKTK